MRAKWSIDIQQLIEIILNGFRRTNQSHIGKIRVESGEIRGYKNLKWSLNTRFQYRRCELFGKSTILALVACAYHNLADGYIPRGRRTNYYTYSDFFIQSNEEVHPVVSKFDTIFFMIAGVNPKECHWYWCRCAIAVQEKRGKWRNIPVAKAKCRIFGIERVVPHSEKSVSKSYKILFQERVAEGCERMFVKLSAGYWVTITMNFGLRNTTNTGFLTYLVMAIHILDSTWGPGNALIEIFSTIFTCPEGVMLVIDEIEWVAWKSTAKINRWVKKLCKERHVQIVCTTHSSTIFDSVPPEGRFFIERRFDETIIVNGVSSAYVAGRWQVKTVVN